MQEEYIIIFFWQFIYFMEFECIQIKRVWDGTDEIKNRRTHRNSCQHCHRFIIDGCCVQLKEYREMSLSCPRQNLITLFSDTNVLQASVGFCRYHRYAHIAKHCFSLNFESIRTVIWPQIEQDYFYIINLDCRNKQFSSFHRRAHKLVERMFIFIYLQ